MTEAIEVQTKSIKGLASRLLGKRLAESTPSHGEAVAKKIEEFRETLLQEDKGSLAREIGRKLALELEQLKEVFSDARKVNKPLSAHNFLGKNPQWGSHKYGMTGGEPRWLNPGDEHLVWGYDESEVQKILGTVKPMEVARHKDNRHETDPFPQKGVWHEAPHRVIDFGDNNKWVEVAPRMAVIDRSFPAIMKLHALRMSSGPSHGRTTIPEGEYYSVWINFDRDTLAEYLENSTKETKAIQ